MQIAGSHRETVRRDAWIAIGIAAVVGVCFARVLFNGFVGYDDPQYVTRNPHIAAGLNWRMMAWAFTSAYAGNWHPLTWMSHALDVSLFGMAPAGHHLTSLLLHGANAALVFLWLSGMTRVSRPLRFRGAGVRAASAAGGIGGVGG